MIFPIAPCPSVLGTWTWDCEPGEYCHFILFARKNYIDEEALFKAGGEIYNVCVACHQIYWADSSRFIKSDTTQSSPDTP